MRAQGDTKHFKNYASISGLPEQYTRHQVVSIFSRWNVASVMLASRSCALIEFFNPNAVYEADSYFTENKFEDSDTKTKYMIRVNPIQSRYLHSQTSEASVDVHVDVHVNIKESKSIRVPFIDTTNCPLSS